MATKRKDWKAEYEKIAAESRKLAKRANQRMVRLEKYSEREGYSEILKFAYGKAQKYIKSNIGIGKSGKGRFREHIKLYDVSDGTKYLKGADLYRANVMIQRAHIKAIQEFLESESSTFGQSRKGKKTRGIRQIYSNRAKTITDKFLKKFGLEMDEQDLKRFFESKKQSKLEKMLNSAQQYIVAAVIKKENLKSTKRALEKYFKSHIDFSKIEGLDKKDLNARFGESKEQYLDRLGEFVEFTGDEVLDSYIIEALKEGIDVNNLFL